MEVSCSLDDFARKYDLNHDAMRAICVAAVADDRLMRMVLNPEVSGSAPTTEDAPMLFWLWNCMEPWRRFERCVNEALRPSVEAVPVTGAIQQVCDIVAQEQAGVASDLKDYLAREEAA